MVKQDIILGAPPIAIAGSNLIFGYTLPEWAAIVTIAYTGLLILKIVVQAWAAWLKRRNKSMANGEGDTE